MEAKVDLFCGLFDELWEHEAFVDAGERPVESGDKDLERRGADGEGVFEAEEAAGVEDVGEEGDGEGESGEEQTDDGEVLEVPAVAEIDVVGIVDEAANR